MFVILKIKCILHFVLLEIIYKNFQTHHLSNKTFQKQFSYKNFQFNYLKSSLISKREINELLSFKNEP